MICSNEDAFELQSDVHEHYLFFQVVGWVIPMYGAVGHPLKSSTLVGFSICQYVWRSPCKFIFLFLKIIGRDGFFYFPGMNVFGLPSDQSLNLQL